MHKTNLPIGVFDSGVGGITVLAEMVRLLPKERFLYFGDNLHAPYGTKNTEKVKELTLNAIEYLVKQGVKAIVLACNTATSAAIHELRAKYDMPILGMEPALKPAVMMHLPGKILVMATPLTLREKKFQNLLLQYHNEADIVPVSCPGLVELIESGELQGQKIQRYLDELYNGIDISKVSAIVLGCTHYLYIKPEISKRFNEGTVVVDGNYGTTKHLERTLDKHGLLNLEVSDNGPEVQFYTTGDTETLEKYEFFFDYALKYIYPK